MKTKIINFSDIVKDKHLRMNAKHWIEGRKMLSKVIFFSNGMVMAFDQSGEQVAKCQGFIFETVEKLKKWCDKDTVFEYANWNKGTKIECNFKWWFEQKKLKTMKGSKDG